MDKASLFNEYFHSVFTTSNFELPPACDRPEPVSCLSDLIITTTKLYQVLSSLDPGKAMECDGIGPKLLKHCALALHEPFHHLFFLCATFQRNGVLTSYVPSTNLLIKQMSKSIGQYLYSALSPKSWNASCITQYGSTVYTSKLKILQIIMWNIGMA